MSFFSLLAVDCQLEILEFLVIYNDVIDRQFLARLTSQARQASSLFVLLLCVKFFIQFIFEYTSDFDTKWGSPYSGTIY